MAKNPVKDPAFQKTLKNLLSMKPKPHSEMKIGKRKAKAGAKANLPKPAKATPSS